MQLRHRGQTAAVGCALLLAAGLGVLPIAAGGQAHLQDRIAVGDRAARLGRDTAWVAAGAVPLAFKTHHPQGMVRVGDALFVSSVEIRRRTKRFPKPVDGYDRDPGDGAGHLFKIDLSGNRLAAITLGEGTIYHPGGIDFDGTHLWVPVAEYRPDSRAIVYRVDPATLRAEAMLRVDDHIGAIVRNPDDNTLHGISWGSRRFYRWTQDRDGRVTNGDAPLVTVRRDNPSHYVDYQDCKYAGHQRMLCSGTAALNPPGGRTTHLGGLDLVDLRDGRPVRQVPVPLWTAGGLDMTHNPVWIEARGDGLRGYFLPEDDASTLYIYDAALTPPGR